jgi:hypothetical protein
VSGFEKFRQKHGVPQQCREISAAQLERYNGKLPELLLEEWRNAGWCCYGNGLLWTVNPADFDDVLPDWVDEPEGKYVYLRTAFGSMFYWDGSDNYFLDTLTRDTSRLFDRIDYVFNGTLTGNDYLELVLLKSTFQAVLPRLGQLGREECYGLLPPLALGGELVPDAFERVKLKEYLAFLAQL